MHQYYMFEAGELKIVNTSYTVVVLSCYSQLITIRDTLCENPAKVIFCDVLFSTKNIIHKVKNILKKYDLYIFNID